MTPKLNISTLIHPLLESRHLFKRLQTVEAHTIPGISHQLTSQPLRAEPSSTNKHRLPRYTIPAQTRYTPPNLISFPCIKAALASFLPFSFLHRLAAGCLDGIVPVQPLPIKHSLSACICTTLPYFMLHIPGTDALCSCHVMWNTGNRTEDIYSFVRYITYRAVWEAKTHPSAHISHRGKKKREREKRNA